MSYVFTNANDLHLYLQKASFITATSYLAGETRFAFVTSRS